MTIQSLRSAFHPAHAETGKHSRTFLFLTLTLIMACSMIFWSCVEGGELIDKPDEFTHVFEAKEKFILRAIAQIFKDKDLGKAAINEDANEVVSDYIVKDDWRTRSIARIRQISRMEREVTLSVITEKKTSTGWEMRRLLEKEQYEKIFNAIDTQIYREMYKIE